MTAQHDKPLILVDGSSYLYRAFHALPPLTNSAGLPTGAIYGVINMLRRLLADYQPQHIAVVFDAKGKTFRDELYEAYKANRGAMPEELIKQIDPLHDIIRAMGIPLLVVEGIEADDVIGTLAVAATQQGLKTLISTGDKDFAQLVNEHITLVNTMSNSILTPLSVEEKFGIPPHLIIDYLTLTGDAIDNIPGVPQVGPKTAVKWLKEHGNLDNLLANADKISGKVGENLRACIEKIPLTKILVTIKTDAVLPLSLEELQLKSADQATLQTLFKTLEFKTWFNELAAKDVIVTENKYAHYEIILSEQQFEKYIAQLCKAKIFAFDTETTSLDPFTAKLVGLSFAIEPGKAIYIPFGHDYTDAPKQLSEAYVLEKIKPILENPAIKKIAHNLKYDSEVLAQHKIDVQGCIYDTMLESYVLESISLNHGLDSLAAKCLDWSTIKFEDIAGKGQHQLTFNQIEVQKAGTYAAEDADVTLQLHQQLLPKIEKESGLTYVLNKIELPLIPVLTRMERCGVLIDAHKLKLQSNELNQRLREIELEAYTLAGMPFNLNSPKQLQEILFQRLGLPVLQKTPTGQASTADAVLQELALSYPLPKIIIECRSLSKLISTYTDRLPQQIHPLTGRIHTSYNQTGTATGRLSSSDPNLQNIPIRTAEGRRIRQAFIAAPGYKLISADYSQIELRLMAHISEDPNLLRAFKLNLDIHKATAAEVWGFALDEVTADMRRNAKAINFGLVYGMSSFGLAQQLGIAREAAQEYIDLYFSRYSKVMDYMVNTRATAHQLGYVETLWGRRLYLPEINAAKIMRQRAAERAAINAPLQGSAADIIKLAMINIDQWLEQSKINAKMIMQVHDELVFEVAEQDVPEALKKIQHYMENVVPLKVPLQVAIGVGDNWDAASSH